MKLSKKSIYIISISVIVIIVGVILFLLIFNNNKETKTNSVNFTDDLKSLGIDFYENSYYPGYLDKQLLSQFKDNPINLSLTAINRDAPISDKLKEKLNDKKCDFDKTKIVIYPYEPYGPKDYKVEVELFCE